MKHMKIELLNHTPISVLERALMKPYAQEKFTPEQMAKIVLGKDKFTEHHGSVLEHVYFNFEVTGFSRLCLQEYMRHRIASPTVESTRFTLKKVLDMSTEELRSYQDLKVDTDVWDFGLWKGLETVLYVYRVQPNRTLDLTFKIEDVYNSKLFELLNRYFVFPPIEMITDKFQFEYLVRLMDTCWTSLYNLYRLFKTGEIKNDMLKYLIVENWRTNMVWSINLRSFLNFIRLRKPTTAHFEIRNIATQAWTIVSELPDYGEFFASRWGKILVSSGNILTTTSNGVNI